MSTDKTNAVQGAPGGVVETIKRNVQKRLDALGISEREASRRAGLGLGYVNDLLKGRARAPETDRIVKLAEALEVEPGYLMGVESESPAAPMGGGFAFPLYAAPLPIGVDFVAMPESPVAEVGPIPAGVTYAVTVWNDLNAPRFFPGETVLVAPGQAVRLNDFAFVRTKAGEAGIVQMLGADGDRIRLGTLRGESVREMPADEVATMDRITGTLTA